MVCSCVLLLCAAAVLLGVLAAEGVRHNIVFVVVDDLPAHIDPFLDPTHPMKESGVNYTPNIKKLAEESVIFHRAYAQNAACNPSRASMLTSRTPIELQLFTKYKFSNLPSVPQTLPNLFRSTHRVVGTGKIFHNGFARQFDRYVGMSTGDQSCGRSIGSECILPERDLVDSQVVAVAIRLAREAKRSTKPVFLFAGFHRPHWEYSTSAVSRAAVDPAFPDITEQTRESAQIGALASPSDRNGSPYFAAAISAQARNNASVSVARASQHRRAVFASTQWMDTCLGRLLDGLKPIFGGFGSTIIILVADNGVMLFDRSQSGKSVLYNAAKRVPLMIRHPDYLAAGGKASASQVELMDLMPTLIESEQAIGPPRALTGTSLMPIIRLLAANRPNAPSYSPSRRYWAGVKVGSITVETRCTVADPSILSKIPRNTPFNGEWVACHQINNAARNRVEMFGLSVQTQDYNYIEWRVAQWDGGGARGARWDAGGLWGRELYDYSQWNSLTTMNNVEFEAVNVAPCTKTCFPRALSYPKAPRAGGRDSPIYYLPDDDADTEYDPPDLDQVLDPKYISVVRRLSLLLRSTIRDKKPVCNGHGLANPATGACDSCIPGWHGTQCGVPDFPEFASEAFPLPPSLAPTTSPTFQPSRSPTPEPTSRPTPPTPRVPTRMPTVNSPTQSPTPRYSWWTRQPTKRRRGRTG